ncbi:S-layer homology domain-containing protein [Cohnella herbarum]|uniref:S-layer homology domain-containing protein n=1 Tax=Cohnella herbarum TaxID=2728023 RepID=A0A7Z2VLH3_9BACL|nr:S-layer homology domain-containing protein [Cohnella herbarum]QJD85272.1 S-layer homology domain-containing protein [Cohnella herbarum]
MKKSLSLLLSIALVFGLFASMASAAETVELTVAQKYQALKDKGILKGTTTGSDGLDDKLTRAQFATIAIALADLAPATEGNTFTDVNNKQWWYGAIEAAAKAGLVEGSNGKFDPKGDVTVEQVIVIAARILKLEEVKDAKVEGASAWAAGYIQAAINKGLTAARTDYTKSATRGQAIEVGYTAYVTANPEVPAKASVSSAKATGVAKVEVVLDKAVDTEKAKLTLKRGTGSVATETKWADDKKSATLTLTSTKITEADYSVTLSGLTAEEIGTDTASFKGEKEAVTKLEFATASEEIAHSNATRVRLRAENQYGELASFNASSYTVNITNYNEQLTKDSDGYLVVKLNTTGATVTTTPGLTMIPIYVYFNETHLTASKTFKLGFAPFVTKMELGELKYQNGKTALINTGDTATASVKLFDQYGNPVANDQTLATPVTFNNNIVPYAQYAKVETGDFDNDNGYDVRLSLTDKEDKASTHTMTLYSGSANAKLNFEIGTSKVATKLELDAYEGTLASGDSGKFVTLNAYDANGDKLTTQEIVENAKKDRIKVGISGVTGTADIALIGPNKGKIALPTINAPAKSVVFITASILSPNANDFKTLRIPVSDARIPASVAVTKKPHVKTVLGTSSDFTIKVKDQYGDDFGTNASAAKYRVALEFVNHNTVGSAVYNSGIAVTGLTLNGGAVLNGTAGADPLRPAVSGNGQVAYVANTQFDTLNDGATFTSVGTSFGEATLKATLEEETTTPGIWKAIYAPQGVSIESIDATKVALNYSLESIASLYAGLDSGLLVTGGAQVAPNTSAVAKTVSLVVKDNAGNSVAYPDSIASITVENPNVAKVVAAGNKGYVLGNKAGETTVTAVVYKALNNEQAVLTAKVTVKNDLVAVDSVSAKGSNDAAVTAGSYIYTNMDLKVKDQYGIEYAGANINGYDSLVGIRYAVSEVTGANVSINATTGLINSFATTAAKYEFIVTATAPNGKSASTLIHN